MKFDWFGILLVIVIGGICIGTVATCEYGDWQLRHQADVAAGRVEP